MLPWCQYYQRWSREHYVRGQGQGLKKIGGQGPTFGGQILLSLGTETVEATAKDQRHNFSKLWSANFPQFLNAKVLKILHFVKFLMEI